MMAGEVALALMLVVGAGLLASSLVRLYRSGVGFDPKGLDNISISLDKLPLKGDAVLQFYRQLEDGLRRQPGVTSVSFARMVPFTHFVWDDDLSAGPAKPVHVYFNPGQPRLLSDHAHSPPRRPRFHLVRYPSTGLKIVLNQAAAKALFPDRSPLGQTIINLNSKPVLRYEVIGVVGDAKYEDLRTTAPATAYLPMTQYDGSRAPTTTPSSAPMAFPGPLPTPPALWPAASSPPFLRRAHPYGPHGRRVSQRRAHHGPARFLLRRMRAPRHRRRPLWHPRLSTARRTSEIGIRMALGARRPQVVAMVFLQNAGVALAGTAIGLVAALLASRALLEFPLRHFGPRSVGFRRLHRSLALIASAASLLPALRSARINPISAIRCE